MKLTQIDTIPEILKKIDLAGLRDRTTSSINKAKINKAKIDKA